MKKGIVVYAFAGTGKSFLASMFNNTIDLEEHSYRYLDDSNANSEELKGLSRLENPEFPTNYFNAIEQHLKKYDYVFVSYNAIKYCQDNSIDYIMFFPKKENKKEYINRYKNRNNPKEFISNLSKNFCKYIKKESQDKYAEKIIYLNNKEFLYNAFERLNLIKSGVCVPYNKSRISLIIPIYNSEKYLNNLFDSINKQTYKDCEYILIDDGSTDNSKIICEEFCNKNKNAIYKYKNNGGVSSARNLGIKICTGNYICFVDSDDTLEPNYCQCLFDGISKNNVDFCMSGLNEITNSNAKQFGPKKELIGNSNDGNFFIQMFNNCWFPVPWNKIYKRSIIIYNNLLFNENLSYDEDTLFNYEYYCMCRFIRIIPDNIYNYYIRTSPLSLTNKGMSKIFENSLKTADARLFYPKKLFGENKGAVYISAKKILKAVIQEGNYLTKENKSKDEIKTVFENRLKTKQVKNASKYITMLENNYAEFFSYYKIFIERNFDKYLQIIGYSKQY